MLPNLIVIGAARCGTTSLHAYLGAHPDVFMAREKELDFFVEEANWGKGVGWYERQFPDRGALVYGEASPDYTLYPIHRDVPARMVEIVPDARLVYLVRDPIDRIVSNLHLSLRTGSLDASVDDALRRPGTRYVPGSRYASQLERYLGLYPDDRILVVDLDDLVHRREDTMRRIFAFAGIDPGFSSPTFQRVWNRGPGHGRKHRLGRVVVAGMDGILGRRRSHRLRRRVPPWAKRPFVRAVSLPTIDGPTREWLAETLAPEVDRLRELTGQRFAGWSL